MLQVLLLLWAAAAHAATPYIDITVPVRPGLPIFQQQTGLPKNWRTRHMEISDGDMCNQSMFVLDAHTGTHVDAPVHFIDNADGIETLDINVLIGKALVVEVPDGSNITADALKQLQLPADVERVLFKTDNTAKRLMYQKEFAPSFTAIESTGAAYITKHTNIKLVGVDYLSVGTLEDGVETHRLLLGKPVIAVEGLDLSEVKPGWYHQICLPAKFAGSDGAPIRCVLQPLSQGDKAGGHNEL